MRSRALDDLNTMEQTYNNDPSNIAIVMFGVQDRYSLGTRRSPASTDEWRTEYAARVDRLMKVLRKGGRAVYLVGLPNMRRWQDNERAQVINDILRERAYLNGARYIDAFASFIDEGGGYSDWGPDVTGKVKRLRDTDGVHFTDAGYRKLAHFVERELKRDMAQARKERSIPLAGDTGEQEKVNPDKVRLKARRPRAPAPIRRTRHRSRPAPALRPRRRSGRRRRARPEGRSRQGRYQGRRRGRHRAGDQRRHRAAGDPGCNRRARHAQAERRPGDADGRHPRRPDSGRPHRHELDRAAARRRRGARRLSPTQTPYYRVFERGERLPSKPGRADDFTWPRPQAAAEIAGEPPPPQTGSSQ